MSIMLLAEKLTSCSVTLFRMTDGSWLVFRAKVFLAAPYTMSELILDKQRLQVGLCF